MASVPDLQDQFLNGARRGGTPVSVFLVKGVRLQGQISGFDAYSFTLRRNETEQLVYKQAVSTILIAQAHQPDIIPSARRGDRQDEFLGRRHGQRVALYLVNGVSLKGDLVAHDIYCLLLSSEDGRQLVFKHALSTVSDAS
ncbi:RNA chaperone Hfq [Sphingomicrobium sp. XHP0239]|uniref:RNA chaperone Hfq n=1 Tax=Sphingomicrobium maritimum TaxID=3133972 RepID=UPI0031CC73F0